MPQRWPRRRLFSGLTAYLTFATTKVTALAQEKVKILERGFFDRLLGNCGTEPPKDARAWSCSNGRLVIDLARAPELARSGGAIRLEGEGLPNRVLVVHGADNQYHAFPNKCTHMGRRLDPVPGTQTVQCCSIGKSTFTYSGQVIYGSAGQPLKPLQTAVENGKLIVTLS